MKKVKKKKEVKLISSLIKEAWKEGERKSLLPLKFSMAFKLRKKEQPKVLGMACK